MQGIARQNGGMRYLLTVIDLFSKFAWAVLVHSTDAKAITVAFDEVLTAAHPRHLRRLQTDKGKEFFNSEFAGLMKRHGIEHVASESEQKAAVVERFNRTIKHRIFTYLSDRGTVRWVDVIQHLMVSYNHSRHRSIGMAPVDVRRRTKTASGCSYTGTVTLTLSHLFPMEQWCGSARKRPSLTRDTCPTGPRSTLR